MAKFSYGCQTYPWKMNKAKFAGDLPHIAKITAQAGFDGLEAEIDMLGDYFDQPEKAKQILDENGLKLAALVLSQAWKGTEETEEERAKTEKALAFVSHFPKAKLMVSHHAKPGDRPDTLEALNARRKNLLTCMACVADRAGEQGVVTMFHPNSSINSLFRTREDYTVLFEMLPKTYVGYAPDIGHIVNGGMDPLEILKESRSLIRHVHFKDRIAQNVWAVMGEGTIDYPAIIQYLKDTDYAGWIMVEDESPKAEADSDAVVLADGAYVNNYR